MRGSNIPGLFLVLLSDTSRISSSSPVSHLYTPLPRPSRSFFLSNSHLILDDDEYISGEVGPVVGPVRAAPEEGRIETKRDTNKT